MKKLTLLCTLLCAASALNGMEPTSQRTGPERGNLPPEVQSSISSYVHTYKKLDDVINAIKTTSTPSELTKIINCKEYDNQKKFTALVHMLADKFKVSTATIAQKFATPASKLYEKLGNKLLANASGNNLNKIAELFNLNADFNYNTGQERTTPLLKAALANNQEMAQLLIRLKANPYFIHPNGMTALEVLQGQQPQEDISMEEAY
jgi:ankyrin repeat protein